jgi:hypothetical protein
MKFVIIFTEFIFTRQAYQTEINGQLETLWQLIPKDPSKKLPNNVRLHAYFSRNYKGCIQCGNEDYELHHLKGCCRAKSTCTCFYSFVLSNSIVDLTFP